MRANLAPGLLGQLAGTFRRGGYAVVHTHLLHADVYGIPAARRARIPGVVTTRHNDDRFRRRWLLRQINRRLWRLADAGIAISEAVRAFCIQVEGAPPGKVHTVHYGLNPETVRAGRGVREVVRAELGLPPSAPLAGSVCRLIEQKGIEYAIRGFWRIAEQVSDAHYLIAGDGPLREALTQTAHSLGLADRVHFLGWRDDGPMLIAALDALLVPSLWEGFGLVLLEAMANNVPVIASRVSALPEIVVNGLTGYLVPPADADSLAEALFELLTNPDLARQLGENGRRRLNEQFSLEQMVRGTLAVYESIGARN